ncbi:MAG: exopolyphosphatase [Eggerthellaceae bacterium]
MARYGIIDLGSNTIRLCIYEVESAPRKPLQKKDISTLLNYKIMAGLASHIKDGAMTKQGIQRAIKTINAHLRRASHFSCERIDIFATAVLRNCTNSREATAAIEAGTKTRIAILSNEEEAHLGFLGACIDRYMEAGTMVDIGGGSTELTHINGGLDLDKISIPQGSLSSFSTYVKELLPTSKEREAIAKNFRSLATKHDADIFTAPQLFGIGGSIRSAAKIYGDLCNDGERFEYLTPEHLDAILALYEKDPGLFVHEALRTVPDRIHTFIPGCIIIREVFSLYKAQRLDILKFGVREGYLAERVLVKPVSTNS